MRGRDDDGFTLVELVLAVTLMGVVIGAVASAMIVMFTTTGETTERLSESPDLQLAAAYFGSDVQSAKTFTGSCGPAGTALVTMAWTDPGASPNPAAADDTERTVRYVVETAGTQKTLVRYACTGSGSPDKTTLVDFIDPTSTPTLACTPGCGSPSSQWTALRIEMRICTADAASVCKNPPLPFAVEGAVRRTTP